MKGFRLCAPRRNQSPSEVRDFKSASEVADRHDVLTWSDVVTRPERKIRIAEPFEPYSVSRSKCKAATHATKTIRKENYARNQRAVTE